MLSTVILLGILLFITMNLKTIRKYLHCVKLVNELPRKKGILIFGNMFEFTGTPAETFHKLTVFMNEYSRKGILSVWMLFFPFVIITEPEVIEKVLKSPVNNTKGSIYAPFRPWLNEGLLTSSDQKWHMRRKMLTPAYHFNILLQFLQIFNEESRQLVKKLQEHAHKITEIQPIISNFTLNTICETAMGTRLDDYLEEGEKYRLSVHDFGVIIIERIVKTWLLIEPIFRFSESYQTQSKHLKVLHGFTEGVIQDRKKTFPTTTSFEKQEPASSLRRRNMAMLDLLLTEQKLGADIDDKGIREEVDTFIFEGHDTTAVSLNFTLMLLANNKSCQDKVHDELEIIFGDDNRDPTYTDLQDLKYLECCIKESLRLYPSVPKIGRKAGEDILLDSGKVIPKGCDILILIYEMHRRPDLYPNPDVFDPDRFLPENTVNKHPFSYLPFSAGPRNCIGQKFAMMEMKCALSAILRNYLLEPIDSPETIAVSADMVLRTVDNIRIKFIPKRK